LGRRRTGVENAREVVVVGRSTIAFTVDHMTSNSRPELGKVGQPPSERHLTYSQQSEGEG
jgi:hypothetical protein